MDSASCDSPLLRGDEFTVKILIVGGFGVGKTTLVSTMSQITPLSTEETMTAAGAGTDDLAGVQGKTTTTVAMDFGRLHLDARVGGQQVVLYLFGTPGQKRFWFLLDDLARGALGALVLMDTRRLENSYDALGRLEELGLPYAIAINDFDDAPTYPVARLREVLDLEDRTPLTVCDARNQASSKQALVTLVEHLLTSNAEPAR
ncbi:ATP-binding protein [Streptomyces nanshensis]|nr:ATP-binding protein [Streptomyces nanshensis]